ncbi:hypothetical protein BDY19DRAFT_994898 [Irpex rosettiformis]|uniref:Uncharacterized protein n=1 Tax=Irpex rosettiformis TaxID=378272 RepID=A0ACB8TZY5_9APHY|nr:hypothetical protein BDY19DRAFT_994898 [Irpex rosettiformis]
MRSRNIAPYDAVVTDFEDPNLDLDQIDALEDDSPYPEVRSAVANTDNHNISVNTFRARCIGIYSQGG